MLPSCFDIQLNPEDISAEFYWQITFIIYVPVLSRVWDVIHIKILHVIFLLERLTHTTLTYIAWLPKSKTMRLVTPKENPSYGISDLYKQWPQNQESNRNYPQVSLPSTAPGEPPWNLGRLWEFYIYSSLSICFIWQLWRSWSSPALWARSAIFVLWPEKHWPAVVGLSPPPGALQRAAKEVARGVRMDTAAAKAGEKRAWKGHMQSRISQSYHGWLCVPKIYVCYWNLPSRLKVEESTWACVFDWGTRCLFLQALTTHCF